MFDSGSKKIARIKSTEISEAETYPTIGLVHVKRPGNVNLKEIADIFRRRDGDLLRGDRRHGRRNRFFSLRRRRDHRRDIDLHKQEIFYPCFRLLTKAIEPSPTRDLLEKVHPIPEVPVSAEITLSTIPDNETVDAVESDRNAQKQNLHERQMRKTLHE